MKLRRYAVKDAALTLGVKYGQPMLTLVLRNVGAKLQPLLQPLNNLRIGKLNFSPQLRKLLRGTIG